MYFVQKELANSVSESARLCHVIEFNLNLKFEFLAEGGATASTVPLSGEMADGYEQKDESG
jgi:hypothetical protein